MSPTPPTAGLAESAERLRRCRSPGQQREHARREPAPGVRRPGAPGPAPAGGQRGRTARPGARALPTRRRHGAVLNISRRRRGGLRDVGRVRILEGRLDHASRCSPPSRTCACTPSTPATCAPRCTRPRSPGGHLRPPPATVAPGCSTCCTAAVGPLPSGRPGRDRGPDMSSEPGFGFRLPPGQQRRSRRRPGPGARRGADVAGRPRSPPACATCPRSCTPATCWS